MNNLQPPTEPIARISRIVTDCIIRHLHTLAGLLYYTSDRN